MNVLENCQFYLFPYEKVEMHAKIIIYGAGRVGQCYWQQIERTGYCDVICIVDTAYEQYPALGIPLYSPDKIDNCEYDKILIAVNSKDIAQDIKKSLIEKYLIDETKIICGHGRGFSPAYHEKNSLIQPVKGDPAYLKDKIPIVFYLSGGLGDCIIAKRLIKEIVFLAKDDCLVDIYGYEKNIHYIKTIFAGCYFINDIFIGEAFYKRECKNYALALNISYLLAIDSLKASIIQRRNSELAQKLICLQNKIKEYQIDMASGKNNALHFAQCRLKGNNCYTTYNYDGIFTIENSKVDIPLVPQYLLKFQALGLKKYVTLNYGWGENPGGKNKPPSKIWPIAYYERFTQLFKSKFPQIEMVQLGVVASHKIKGIDRYIFGESIELTKYILKQSVLHIDCEGGLVHLATQLGTKCAVLFGPTPVQYFGYKENINIASTVCNNCYYLNNDFSKCIRNLEKPECMYSIRPDRVMKEVEEYLIKGEKK